MSAAAALPQLLDDLSLEITGKQAGDLASAAAMLPLGSRIHVTYLAGEDLDTRVRAARAVAQIGAVPVPHLAARRLGSQGELERFLGDLRDVGASSSVFTVAGDPAKPQGPFEDSLALIDSGLLERFGAEDVAVAGYPEGHPDIPEQVLWEALERKHRRLTELGLAGDIVTQFGFDADAVLTWIELVRGRGIEAPIRVGVPGPAGVKRLLAYAKYCGVATSVGIAKKYGFSLTNLMTNAGPERFIDALAEGYDAGRHGAVKLHVYTFGGLLPTAEWLDRFLTQQIPS